ncbi:hypothetical protein PRK78_003688 [Emydomyces testavorans]|uniref:DNA-binding protein RAP1 n=1 Tax=Emydomyces testavorans TaxID=2070801 RepID=A0AAF0DJN5_9EURO|nr:hypothetical protein PRK78_003688 [Emydomyces testavorans]
MASSSAESPPLFNNKKFFLSATVPQRDWCASLIKNHGGKVVQLEKNADIHLVDHMRKDIPPGCYSFKFIDRCLRAGKVLDLEEFRAGPAPGQVRPVGSRSVPTRVHRVCFTAKDDQILYDWVKPIEKDGGPIRGNKIYQQLEELHPQHTYQSWRDRYLKVVKDRARPVTREDDTRGAEPAEPARSDVSRQGSPSSARRRSSEAKSVRQSPPSFLSSEEDELLRAASSILEVDPDRENDFWVEYASQHDQHTATEWKNHFHTFVRPKYVAKVRAKKAAAQKMPSSSPARSGLGGPRIPAEPTTPAPAKKIAQTASKPVKRARQDTEASSEEERENIRRKRRKLRVEVDTILSPDPVRSRADSTNGQLAGHVQKTSSPRRTNSDETVESPVELPLESVSRPISETNTPSPIPLTQSIALASGALAPAKPTSPSTSSSNEQYETAPQNQLTQELFANPTQYADELNALLHPTLTDIPEEGSGNLPSQEITEEEKEEIQELDQWIESRLKSGRARDEDQIIQALSCTSMNPYLADKVLDYLIDGKGIPTNIPGIWTEEEDHLLETGDSSGDYLKLKEKHGEEYCDVRGIYLNTLRQVNSA